MIPTPQRYVVILRPAKDEPLEYVGPFVSEEIAERFAVDEYPDHKTLVRPLLSRDQANSH